MNVTPVPLTAQRWADSITLSKDNDVLLNMGNRAGGNGSADDRTLCVVLLSHELSKYPKATTVTVTWSYTVAGGTDQFKLVYNRPKRVLTFWPGWRGSSLTPEKHPARGVTDKMIRAMVKPGDF